MSTITNNDNFTAKDFQEMGIAYGVQASDNCPICWESFTDSKAIVELACRHISCVSCFEALPINLQSNCSTCREETKPSRYFLKKFGILETHTPKTTKEILLEKIESCHPNKMWELLNQLDPNFIDDQELVVVILHKMHFDWGIIDVLDDDLKNNSQFMLRIFVECLQKEGPLPAIEILHYVGDDLRNNKAFMTKILEACPQEHSLWLVSCIGHDLLRDKGFMIHQVSKKILGRSFSHHRDQNDKKMVLKVLELISVRDVVMVWKEYKLKGVCLCNNKEIALKFLEKCHPSDALQIFNYAGDKLKKDLDFKQACYEKAQIDEDSLIKELTGYDISFDDVTAFLRRYVLAFG